MSGYWEMPSDQPPGDEAMPFPRYRRLIVRITPDGRVVDALDDENFMTPRGERHAYGEAHGVDNRPTQTWFPPDTRNRPVPGHVLEYRQSPEMEGEPYPDEFPVDRYPNLIRDEIPYQQGGATDDLFRSGGDRVDLGTPFSWRSGIAPDGRGDDDIPLDTPSDCSSFIANLVAHLTGDKIRLPALTDDIMAVTEPVEPGSEEPLDIAMMQYPGQGDIDWGHIGMVLDPERGAILDQSTSDEGLTGRPGIDIRPVDHPFEQGGTLVFRRIPGLNEHR